MEILKYRWDMGRLVIYYVGGEKLGQTRWVVPQLGLWVPL